MGQQQEASAKVLARIKKMLALGNDAGATEAERETALKMAYNLLAKYNLSMADLPAGEDQEPREKQNVTISADKWARQLCNHVGRLFFCKYFLERTRTAGKDMHHFVGRQSNVITAMHMSEYLIKSIKKEATRRYKSPTSPEGRSFCVGTVNTISSRINDMLKKDVEAEGAEAGAPGTALALANLHETELERNLALLQSIGIDLKTPTGRTDNALRREAFRDGKEYGKTVSLNQQVTGGTAPKRTLIGN